MAELSSHSFVSGGGISAGAARAELLAEGGPTSTINWANMGLATGSLLDFRPGTRTPPFARAKAGNRDVMITHPLDLIYFTSGSQAGWMGRFGQGDGVIFTNDVPPQQATDPWKESIILHLPFGIRGAGMQFDIKPPNVGATPEFTAHILSRHRNWSDYILAEGTGSIAPGQPAGSAVFVGTMGFDGLADYVTLEIWVTARNGQQIDFAINQVSLLV